MKFLHIYRLKKLPVLSLESEKNSAAVKGEFLWPLKMIQKGWSC